MNHIFLLAAGGEISVHALDGLLAGVEADARPLVDLLLARNDLLAQEGTLSLLRTSALQTRASSLLRRISPIILADTESSQVALNMGPIPNQSTVLDVQ